MLKDVSKNHNAFIFTVKHVGLLDPEEENIMML
jgi:hypothetical protein